MQLALFVSSTILICIVSCVEGNELQNLAKNQPNQESALARPKGHELKGYKRIPAVSVETKGTKDFTSYSNRIFHTNSNLWECARDTTIDEQVFRYSIKCVWYPRESAEKCWGYYDKDHKEDVLWLACQKTRPNNIPDSKYKEYKSYYGWELVEEPEPNPDGGATLKHYKE